MKMYEIINNCLKKVSRPSGIIFFIGGKSPKTRGKLPWIREKFWIMLFFEQNQRYWLQSNVPKEFFYVPKSFFYVPKSFFNAPKEFFNVPKSFFNVPKAFFYVAKKFRKPPKEFRKPPKEQKQVCEEHKRMFFP